MTDQANYHDFALEVKRDEILMNRMKEIPFIQFPPDWKVQIIPPFHGAIVRFCVSLPSGHHKSIYLDWFDRLGAFGAPYWEVHPYKNDVGRCEQADVFRLLEMIADEPED